jgi:hypothetical protein
MKKNSFNLFFISAVLFLGCSGNDQKIKSDSVVPQKIIADTVPKIKIIPPQKITENGLAGFYVLNDKSAGTPDTAKLLPWLESFLDSINQNNIDGSENLFNNGGGPMGAQLNPGADLLFTAFFKGKMDTSSLQFKINDFPVMKQKTGISIKTEDEISICWFLIPKNRYTVMLHLPSEKEKNEICSLKNLEVRNWIKNSCTVLKVSAEAKVNGENVKLENYLLVTFGE